MSLNFNTPQSSLDDRHHNLPVQFDIYLNQWHFASGSDEGALVPTAGTAAGMRYRDGHGAYNPQPSGSSCYPQNQASQPTHPTSNNNSFPASYIFSGTGHQSGYRHDQGGMPAVSFASAQPPERAPFSQPGLVFSGAQALQSDPQAGTMQMASANAHNDNRDYSSNGHNDPAQTLFNLSNAFGQDGNGLRVGHETSTGPSTSSFHFNLPTSGTGVTGVQAAPQVHQHSGPATQSLLPHTPQASHSTTHALAGRFVPPYNADSFQNPSYAPHMFYGTTTDNDSTHALSNLPPHERIPQQPVLLPYKTFEGRSSPPTTAAELANDSDEDSTSSSDLSERPAQRRRLNEPSGQHSPPTMIARSQVRAHQDLIDCLSDAAIPYVGFQLLIGMGSTPTDSEVAVEMAAALHSPAVAREVNKLKNTIKDKCIECQQEQDKEEFANKLVDQLFTQQMGPEASVKVHEKVKVFIAEIIRYVVEDLVQKEDVFGLAEYDNDYGRDTLMTGLGWLATTGYPSHLYLLHPPNKALSLVDIVHCTLKFPRAGSQVLGCATAVELDGARYIAMSFSSANNEKKEKKKRKDQNEPDKPLLTTTALAKASFSQSAPDEQQATTGTCKPTDKWISSTIIPDGSQTDEEAGMEQEQDVEVGGPGQDDKGKGPGKAKSNVRTNNRRHSKDKLLRTQCGDNKGVIVNFHGTALMKTTLREYQVLHKDFVDVNTGRSVLECLYEDQSAVDVGGSHDHIYRTHITSGSILSAVLQHMYNRRTLQVNPKEIATDALAKTVMESKLLTAAKNMAQWAKDVPAEHLLLRQRLMGMMSNVLSSNHTGFIKDLGQTFLPANSDHLHIDRQSWTERNHTKVSDAQYSHREMDHTRRLLLPLLPARLSCERLQPSSHLSYS